MAASAACQQPPKHHHHQQQQQPGPASVGMAVQMQALASPPPTVMDQSPPSSQGMQPLKRYKADELEQVAIPEGRKFATIRGRSPGSSASQLPAWAVPERGRKLQASSSSRSPTRPALPPPSSYLPASHSFSELQAEKVPASAGASHLSHVNGSSNHTEAVASGKAMQASLHTSISHLPPLSTARTSAGETGSNGSGRMTHTNHFNPLFSTNDPSPSSPKAAVR
jgi:hypothetical protein